MDVRLVVQIETCWVSVSMVNLCPCLSSRLPQDNATPAGVTTRHGDYR